MRASSGRGPSKEKTAKLQANGSQPAPFPFRSSCAPRNVSNSEVPFASVPVSPFPTSSPTKSYRVQQPLRRLACLFQTEAVVNQRTQRPSKERRENQAAGRPETIACVFSFALMPSLTHTDTNTGREGNREMRACAP